MKKVMVILVALMITVACGGSNTKTQPAVNKAPKVDVKTTLEQSFQNNFQMRGIQNVSATVTVVEEIKEVSGFYFVQVDINDSGKGRKAKQYVISDGTRILPDVVNLTDGSSLLKDLTFKHENYSVDVSNLTLIGGNKDAKNIIVKVSDFQCPFCTKANDDLKKQLAGKSDYALYMLHMPLRIHNQARLRAQILEAGLQLGHNFTNDLYHTTLDDKAIIEDFAKKSGDADKFKSLVKSPEIAAKIQAHEKQAMDMGLSSTPVLFVNGKKIGGFNPALVAKSIQNIQ